MKTLVKFDQLLVLIEILRSYTEGNGRTNPMGWDHRVLFFLCMNQTFLKHDSLRIRLPFAVVQTLMAQHHGEWFPLTILPCSLLRIAFQELLSVQKMQRQVQVPQNKVVNASPSMEL